MNYKYNQNPNQINIESRWKRLLSLANVSWSKCKCFQLDAKTDGIWVIYQYGSNIWCISSVSCCCCYSCYCKCSFPLLPKNDLHGWRSNATIKNLLTKFPSGRVWNHSILSLIVFAFLLKSLGFVNMNRYHMTERQMINTAAPNSIWNLVSLTIFLI